MLLWILVVAEGDGLIANCSPSALAARLFVVSAQNSISCQILRCGEY